MEQFTIHFDAAAERKLLDFMKTNNFSLHEWRTYCRRSICAGRKWSAVGKRRKVIRK